MFNGSTGIVGVDIGGSHVSAGFVRAGVLETMGPREEHHVVSVDELIAVVQRVVRPLLSPEVKVIGVGVPGPVRDRHVLIACANLPFVRDLPLASLLSTEFGVPVFLFNDADCAAAAELLGPHAESKYGLVHTAAMLMLGTGVGMAVLVRGRLLEGCIEGGHMILVPGGRRCGCGQSGCAEMYCSARSVAARFKERTGAEADARRVFAQAEAGDAAAEAVLQETAEHLALLCLNISRLLDPQLIVLAGGLALGAASLLPRVTRHLEDISWTVLPARVRLEVAAAPAEVGVLGAAVAAATHFVPPPAAADEKKTKKRRRRGERER